MQFFKGLSGRLLVLTVIVVMLVEVAVFVPSVSRFRIDYLTERLARAQIASLTLDAAPANEIPEALIQELLDSAEVINIVVERDGVRQFILSRHDVPMVGETYDLRRMPFWTMIWDALSRLVMPVTGDAIRVIGDPPSGGAELIEITLDPAPLKAEMIDYGWRILKLSLIISLITACGVFVLMSKMVVRPLTRLTESVTAFRENPEDPDTTIVPSSKSGEIAEAERALADMQEDVRRALKERARLAGLGEAVAKISHDLRNILGSLQLMLDRLEHSSDPVVSRVLPKMISSLDRAINLCQRTLSFGKAEEPAPEIRDVALKPLLEDVAEGLGLTNGGPVACRIGIAPDETVPADPEQLHRVLTNLFRNAAQAITAQGRPGVITVKTARQADFSVIRIMDNGPGMPKRAVENIFKPFKGGATRGGSGLGLAIAQELVAAHRGRLELVSTTTAGTEFQILLPDK